MADKFSYGKEEKLKSRKLIGSVFSEGKSFLNFPIKVSYLLTESPMDFPVKVGVGVSTRYFKRAVDRNRVKRLLRETYRLNKHPLHEYCKENKLKVAVFFLYIDKQLPEFNSLQTVMQLALNKLMLHIEKNGKDKESKT